jgi:hypothetical protein
VRIDVAPGRGQQRLELHALGIADEQRLADVDQDRAGEHGAELVRIDRFRIGRQRDRQRRLAATLRTSAPGSQRDDAPDPDQPCPFQCFTTVQHAALLSRGAPDPERSLTRPGSLLVPAQQRGVDSEV